MIKVIILEKSLLGKVGDVINVKFGYARNFLIPYQKALYFNDSNIREFNKKKKFLNEIENKKINEIKDIYKKIVLLSPIKLYYKCSKNGKLFNSFKKFDLYKIFLKKLKYKISKKNIFFPNGPIKYIGKHIVNILFYKNRKINFVINIISVK